jgi:hypothetical protein
MMVKLRLLDSDKEVRLAAVELDRWVGDNGVLIALNYPAAGTGGPGPGSPAVGGGSPANPAGIGAGSAPSGGAAFLLVSLVTKQGKGKQSHKALPVSRCQQMSCAVHRMAPPRLLDVPDYPVDEPWPVRCAPLSFFKTASSASAFMD